MHSQLHSAVDLVLHLGRGPDRRRRVQEIGVVRRAPDGTVEVAAGVRFDTDHRLPPGPAFEELTHLVEP